MLLKAAFILDSPLRKGVPARRALNDVCPSVRYHTLIYFDTCVFLFFCRAFEQFKEAFEDLLKDAQADPKGVVAQDLIKKLLPFLHISGRQVPWGSAERNAEVTKLMAERGWYGPGPHFFPAPPLVGGDWI